MPTDNQVTGAVVSPLSLGLSPLTAQPSARGHVQPSEPHGLGDAALIERYRSGDATAAHELYCLYYGDAFGVAYGATKNVDSSEEIASEALTKTLEIIRRGKGPTNDFKLYQRTVVRNLATDWYHEQQQVSGSDPFDELNHQAVGDIADSIMARNSDIIEAFKTLPVRSQHVLYLRAVEHLNLSEVARLLNLRADQASRMYYRARHELRVAYLLRLATADRAVACEIYRELLVKSLIGTLGAPRQKRLDEHLEACGDCEKQRKRLLLIVTRFGSIGAATAILMSAGVLDVPVRGECHSVRSSIPIARYQRRVPLWLTSAAATVTLIVGSTFVPNTLVDNVDGLAADAWSIDQLGAADERAATPVEQNVPVLPDPASSVSTPPGAAPELPQQSNLASPELPGSARFALQLQDAQGNWVAADSYEARADRPIENLITWQGYGDNATFSVPFRLAPDVPRGAVQTTLMKKVNPCGSDLTVRECDDFIDHYLKISLSYNGGAPFATNLSVNEINALSSHRMLNNVVHSTVNVLTVELNLAPDTPRRYNGLRLPFYVAFDAVSTD